MYYPFVRGKQFELIMLRELAPRIAEWGFVPIIEPVKNNFSPLKRTIEKLIENQCHFILVANPGVGDLERNPSPLWEHIFDGLLQGYGNYSAGLNLTSKPDQLELARNFFTEHAVPTAVIHDGFSDSKGLVAVIEETTPNITAHIFVGSHSSTLYRKHFKGANRILVEDKFISRNNREYPLSEPLSELYLTYEDVGCDGFGDYLIVGKGFRNGGGPARAVAIHLTYSDPAADDTIAINHFVSDRVDTLEDVAGKFSEALQKLVNEVNSDQSLIDQTAAVTVFLDLHGRQHFPGLGYVKKLSMHHHIELMANLLSAGK